MNIDEHSFLSKVSKGSGCWNWMRGITEHGYGRVVSTALGNSRIALAHRISYALYKGKIPKGMHVLHRCDNRKCVNPDHLFLGTNIDNIQDKVSKKRQASGPKFAAKMTGIPKFGNRGELNNKAKLSAENIQFVRKNYRRGSAAKLAENFHVNISTIRRIVNGKIWVHI